MGGPAAARAVDRRERAPPHGDLPGRRRPPRAHLDTRRRPLRALERGLRRDATRPRRPTARARAAPRRGGGMISPRPINLRLIRFALTNPAQIDPRLIGSTSPGRAPLSLRPAWRPLHPPRPA